jgi:hypothetical protein
VIAIATVVEILHMCSIILDIYDFVIFCRGLRAAAISALDVVHTRKTRIIFEVWVDVLRVLGEIIDLVIISNTHAFCSSSLAFLESTCFTIVYEMLVLVTVNIQHILTIIAELQNLHCVIIYNIIFKYVFEHQFLIYIQFTI